MSAKAFLIVEKIDGEFNLLDTGTNASALRQKFKHLAQNPEKDMGGVLYFDIYGKTLRKRFKKNYIVAEEKPKVAKKVVDEEIVDVISAEEKPKPVKRKGKK